MLPRLDRLSLKPTGEFYALTPGEVTEEGEDPIHGHFYHPGQTKDSLVATFRVRSKDPRPGTKNQYVYHIFEAESLWEWVKREDHAFNPKNREPLWKEDWLALHEKFDPGSPVPHWVRNLPQLDPNFVDGMPAPPPAPKWAEDLHAAFSLSSDFVEDAHGDTPIEQAITGLVQALRRIKNRWYEEPAEYRDNIQTYNNNPYHDVQWNPANGDPPPSLTDVIDNLLVCVVQYRTMPLRVRTVAIGFVAWLLHHPGAYLQKVADYVYDEDYVDHDDLREALDQYILAITNATDMQPLVRHVTRLDALRLRHHTFWKWPILSRHLKGPPPSAKITAPALTGYADALMILLKEKVEAATNEMGHFTHKEDDVEDFFQLEEHAHYSQRTPYDVGTELLDEIRDLFRKTRSYTEEDDGRQRALTITFFANVLNVFVELWMWNDADDTLFSDHWSSDVQDWAEKLALTLKSVLRYEDSVSTESNAVTTFFWWYVAPLYEAGTVSNQIKAHYFPPHVIERHDVLKGLSLLDDTVARLPADPPAAHERPAGEATPGRRRQRTEE